MKVVLLAGGLGGARLAPALGRLVGPGRLTVIANVGDDLNWMSLRICPDVDSIVYSLAGLWDRARAWGRRGETFRVHAALRRFCCPTWFHVGDLDLALHLARTDRLARGRRLSDVTRDLAARLGVRDIAVLPASDEFAPTRVVLRDGRRLAFQEWYVRARARPPLSRVVVSRAAASPRALEARAAADAVVLGPSNPVTSIGAILALRGMRRAVGEVPRRIALSPVVVGRRSASATIEHHTRARRRALAADGGRDEPASIASRYAGIADSFVVDRADAGESKEIRRLGLTPIVADLLAEQSLARALVDIASR